MVPLSMSAAPPGALSTSWLSPVRWLSSALRRRGRAGIRRPPAARRSVRPQRR